MMKLIKTEHIHNTVNSFYIDVVLPCIVETFETNSLIYNIIDAIVTRITNLEGVEWRVKTTSGNFIRISENERIGLLNKEYNKTLRLKKLERLLDEEI